MTILEWNGVSVQKRDREYPLKEVCGRLRKGRLTCLVGPSGSGKSVLLRALAGRVECTGDIALTDGALTSSASRRNFIGFVSEEDALLPSVTPREALVFSLALRPRLRAAPRKGLVDFYLNLFDLEDLADTQFANLPSLNAKRFSTIASEMISERKVLLLDAPLTGLSQVGGYQFIKTLRKLVSEDSESPLSGILCSVAQPTSEVLSLFADIVLISDGGVIVYIGPVADMAAHFLKFGHLCPLHYNVCDFALFVLHSVTGPAREALLSGARLRKSSTTSSIVPSLEMAPSAEPRYASLFRQLHLLTVREVRDVLRNWKSTLVARFTTTVIVSCVVGAVYYRIGTTTSTSAIRGCLLVMCCNAMLANAQTTIVSLPLQRVVFRREKSLNMYSSFTYLLSKGPTELAVSALQILAQLLIAYFLCSLQGNFFIYWIVLVAVASCAESIALSISCASSDVLSAIQSLPIAFLPQIVFSGLIVSVAAMPVWIRWFEYICFLPYAMKLLAINEFGSFESGQIAFNGGMLVAISVGFRVVALIALQLEPKSFK